MKIKKQATQRVVKAKIDPKSSGMFRWLSIAVLLFSFSLWGWTYLRNPSSFPIEHVKIKGQLTHVSKKDIKDIVGDYVQQQSLFAINTSELRSALLDLPWVSAASISRHWPDTLTITIQEHQALAQWGAKSLVSQQGTLFSPPVVSFPKNLPIILAPNTLQTLALKLYQQVISQLKSFEIGLRQFTLSSRGALALQLHSGTVLYLGREHINQRLQRFLAVYPKVFVNKLNQVQYVDMRYTHGMSVKWKEDSWQKNQNKT